VTVPGLPDDLTVREPAPGDAEPIAQLVAACDETYRAWAPAGWAPPAPADELERWRRWVTPSSGRRVRLAVDPAGRLAGFSGWRPLGDRTMHTAPLEGDAPTAHLAALFVRPDRWRQGIASALLGSAEADMREAGMARAHLSTSEGNPAERFYAARGWTRVGERFWDSPTRLWSVHYVKALA
jgi:GNAT superfamily N-acetyltransferase